MDKKIYLVRHGRIDYGKERCYIGSTDLPLSKEGKNQARKLKEYFSNIEFEKIYVSPLKRCVETSEIIVEGRRINTICIDAFKEIHLGEWEKKSFEYIKTAFPQQYKDRGEHMDTFVTPGGESFYQLQQRVLPTFNHILSSNNENLVIITHAGVNRVILSYLLEFPLKEVMRLKQPYSCVNKVFWDNRMKRWKYETVTIKE